MSAPIIYTRVSAVGGSQLRRIGATSDCIVCGMPEAAKCRRVRAHSYTRSRHVAGGGSHPRLLTVLASPSWGYDQDYFFTMELLQAEFIWIEKKKRPKPHRSDIDPTRRVSQGY